jgi:hypothetical protein
MLTVLWNVTPCSHVERYQHFRKCETHHKIKIYIYIKRRKGYRTVSGVMGYGNHTFKGHCLPLAHDSALGRIPSKWSNVLYTVPLTLTGSLKSPGPTLHIPIFVPLFSVLTLFLCPKDRYSSFLQTLAVFDETI